MKTSRAVIGGCLVIGCTLAAFGTEISGHVRITGAAGRTEASPIVYAEALDDHAPVKGGHYEMTQRDKTFYPHLLAVPAGSSVTFPNADPIFHNVFSLSAPAPFDLGLYRSGSSKTIVFTQPAAYKVFCNIHPQMMAVILVVPTARIAEVDTAGSYRMDLPPGRYRITAWSERTSPVSVPIALESGALKVPEITIDESNFVEAKHKNKFGQDYPRNAYQPFKR